MPIYDLLGWLAVAPTMVWTVFGFDCTSSIRICSRYGCFDRSTRRQAFYQTAGRRSGPVWRQKNSVRGVGCAG
jgi:hypothetical protein